MSDDLYKSPSFQFYPDDFIADTADLTAEEVGIYIRMLCHQWKQGSIPMEPARQANIGRVSVAAMRRAWKTLFRMFSVHGSELIQERLERVRSEAHERHCRYVEAGKKGGRPSSNTNPGFSGGLASDNPGLSDAEGMHKGIEKGSESSPISDLRNKDTNVSGDDSPTQPSLGVEKPSELAAWRILDAAWPVVSEHHELAIKRADWRTHNKRAAKALADNGKTPEQIVEMLRVAYEHPEARRFYGGITTLSKLIEHWPKLAAIDTEEVDESERRRAIANGDYLPRV